MRVETRIKQLRREFNGNTQEVRGGLIADLDELQALATEKVRSAKGANEKRKWMHVAAYLAQTLTCIAKEYDDLKIEAKLNELERLINEDNTEKE
jgi:hypothetical protein